MPDVCHDMRRPSDRNPRHPRANAGENFPGNASGGIVGMEGGEHKVARLRSFEGYLGRLQIAHLTYEDDFWSLAQGSAQSAVSCGRYSNQGIISSPRALISIS